MSLELIPGAGHFVCDAEREYVAARIIAFLTADLSRAGAAAAPVAG